MSDLLYTAVRSLAGVCDHAHSQDGMGFNGVDAGFGHHLAQKPFESWTWRDKANGYKMLGKYRKQLLAYGVDYDEIPQPLTNGEGRYITVKNGRLVIEFPYDANMVSLVKGLPGRVFDAPGKFWTCPISSKMAVLQFAEKHNFSIDPSVFELVEVDATPEPEKPKRPFTVTVSNNEIVIGFEYDPSLVEQVKRLSERRFVKSDNSWRVPVRLAADVVSKFPQAQISPAVLELAGQQEQLASMSKSAVSDFQIPGLKGEPLPYQRAGVQFIELANGRAVVADQMGLGKTLQSLAYLQLHPEKRPCVIVCPASLKINWKREIAKWMTTPDRIVILDGRKSHNLAGLGSLFIINYDVLKYWLDAIMAIEPQVLICDEAHYIKNQSQRSEAVKQLASKVPHVIMLTGTPITNRPRELFPLLNCINASAWPKFFPFGKRYCNGHETQFGWDFSGASNLEELHEKIRPYVVRRTKDQVLKELPAKRRVTLPIEISEKDRREYNRFIAEAKARIEETRMAGGSVGAEHLVLIEKAKQAAVTGKLPVVIDWIRDFIESDKLILFCTHKFVVDALMSEFSETAVKVTGDDSQTQRQTAVDSFQTNPNIKLFIGNIQAAGVGLTLTAASDVAFLELPWVPGEVEQAEDRAHRIGQTDSVTCWYLVAENTIDEQIANLLESKRQVVDLATDGKVSKTSLSLFGELVNQLTQQEE